MLSKRKRRPYSSQCLSTSNFMTSREKNYRLAILKQSKEIVPEKCKVLLKPTKVIVTLFKAFKGNWLVLHLKKYKLNPSICWDVIEVNEKAEIPTIHSWWKLELHSSMGE